MSAGIFCNKFRITLNVKVMHLTFYDVNDKMTEEGPSIVMTHTDAADLATIINKLLEEAKRKGIT